jgi:hypothetical protein
MMKIEISTEEMMKHISAFDVLQHMDDYELSTLVSQYISKNLLSKTDEDNLQSLLDLIFNHVDELKASMHKCDLDALIEVLQE